MKASYFFPMLFYTFLLSGCMASKQGAVDDVLLPAALQPIGRFTMEDGALQMISSGMHFGFVFEGKGCTLYVSSPEQHNYLQYELDGVYQKRLRVEKGDSDLIEITATTEGNHVVWLYKATEAQTGAIHIKKITGSNLSALPAPQNDLIEFIGNSITCGAAADPSDIPCGSGAYHDQHNAYMAYGPRVARTLGTSFILSSVSGIGVYRNWNSNGPAMPQVYPKTTLRAEGQEAWNFARFTPQVVAIALGTNDFSNGDGKAARLPFDSAAFVSSYTRFVQLVKSKYPGAQIALLSSPMVQGDRAVSLQHCLSAVKKVIEAQYADAKGIALFFFDPMQARGCTGHPNVADHAVMANALLPFFKKLLEKEQRSGNQKVKGI